MNEKIEIGDYVEVAWPAPCCGADDSCGQRFVVMNIFDSDECICLNCTHADVGRIAQHAGHAGSFVHRQGFVRNGFDTRRLRKLPPLTADDVHREEVEA